MHADGILLDDTVSFFFFFLEHCVCVYIGGGVRWGRGGELSISLYYCFLKSVVIDPIERRLLQATRKCVFD